MDKSLKVKVASILPKGTPTGARASSPSFIRQWKGLQGNEALAKDIERVTIALNTITATLANTTPGIDSFQLTDATGKVVGTIGDFTRNGALLRNYLQELHIGNSVAGADQTSASIDANADGSIAARNVQLTVAANGNTVSIDPATGIVSGVTNGVAWSLPESTSGGAPLAYVLTCYGVLGVKTSAANKCRVIRAGKPSSLTIDLERAPVGAGDVFDLQYVNDAGVVSPVATFNVAVGTVSATATTAVTVPKDVIWRVRIRSVGTTYPGSTATITIVQ